MATRSTITAKISEGKFKSIYCHWDGYLDHNGRILLNSYTDQQKIDALMDLGDLSSLGASPEKPDGHSFEKPARGHCVAYGRDRGEEGTGARVDYTAAEAQGRCGAEEYNYLWDGSCWSVNGKSLAEAIAKMDANDGEDPEEL